MEIFIGGEPQTFASPLTVNELLAGLSLSGRRIAVELNGEIVPRSRFDQVLLGPGDKLEIVTAVGGG